MYSSTGRLMCLRLSVVPVMKTYFFRSNMTTSCSSKLRRVLTYILYCFGLRKGRYRRGAPAHVTTSRGSKWHPCLVNSSQIHFATRRAVSLPWKGRGVKERHPIRVYVRSLHLPVATLGVQSWMDCRVTRRTDTLAHPQDQTWVQFDCQFSIQW